MLCLQEGDTVEEIGCGTGLNFGILQDQIGPQGRVNGVDMTHAMLDRARHRIERNGWSNIELIYCDAWQYECPQSVDGILSTLALTLVPEFDYVIQRGAESLLKGGHGVVANHKMPSNRFRALHLVLLPLFRPFGVTLDLSRRHPWESIQKYLHRTTMPEFFYGFTYIASGEK